MSLCTTIRQCMDSSTGTEPCAISVRHVDLERDARLRGRRQRGGHLLQHHPPLGERAARTLFSKVTLSQRTPSEHLYIKRT